MSNYVRLTALGLCVCIAVGIISCKTNNQVKWEYKLISVISAEAPERTGDQAGKITTVTPSEVGLNDFGSQGWELVTSYLELETAFPNFGNENYVSGLQPNVRPQRVVLIFKRPHEK